MTYSLYMTFHSLSHLPSDLISNPLSLVHSALAIQTSFLFLEYAKAYLDSQSLLFLFSLPGILFFNILPWLTISSISNLYLKFTSMRTFLNTLITCLLLPQHCLSHYLFYFIILSPPENPVGTFLTHYLDHGHSRLKGDQLFGGCCEAPRLGLGTNVHFGLRFLILLNSPAWLERQALHLPAAKK